MADTAQHDAALPVEVRDALDAMNWHARLEDARERRARVLELKAQARTGDAEIKPPLATMGPGDRPDTDKTFDHPAGTGAIYLMGGIACLTVLLSGTIFAIDRAGGWDWNDPLRTETAAVIAPHEQDVRPVLTPGFDAVPRVAEVNKVARPALVSDAPAVPTLVEVSVANQTPPIPEASAAGPDRMTAPGSEGPATVTVTADAEAGILQRLVARLPFMPGLSGGPVAAMLTAAPPARPHMDKPPEVTALDGVRRVSPDPLIAPRIVDQFADLITVMPTAYPPSASTPDNTIIAGLPFEDDALLLGGPTFDAPRPLARPEALAENHRVVRLIGQRFAPDQGSTVSRNRTAPVEVVPVRPSRQASAQPTRQRATTRRADRAALDALAEGLRRELARQSRRDRNQVFPGIRLIIRRGD